MNVNALKCHTIAVPSRLPLTSKVCAEQTASAVIASVCAVNVRRKRMRGCRSVRSQTETLPVLEPVKIVRESPHTQQVISELSQSS